MAAPVVVSREHLARSAARRARSSSTAAAPTPAPATKGCRRARHGRETARLLGCPAEQVLVASTGVIGVRCRSRSPQRPAGAVDALGRRPGALAARAIMTTDPFPKESAAQIAIGGLDVRIGGMAKGSGMIEPMLATMLGFVTTDAACRRRCSTARCGKRSTRRSTRSRSTASARPTTA
jgi:glutamate N-acetyltransferase/amino-acid N-acetyltransferase